MCWLIKLKLLIGPGGYQIYMRRSLQTVLLHEAKRCIAHRLPSLRPFQRRALLLGQVCNILEAIDFLSPEEKEAVLWRTQRSRVQLDEVTAWKRAKIVERDLAKLRDQIRKYVHPTRTHQESVDMLVQASYNVLHQITPQPGSALITPPPQWEFLHNHAFLLLRLCFRGHEVDPNFPPPDISFDNISLPSQRPVNQRPVYRTFTATPLDPAASGTGAIDTADTSATSAILPSCSVGTRNQLNLKKAPPPAQHVAASRQQSNVSAVTVSASDNNHSNSTSLSVEATAGHETSNADRLQSLVAVREQIELLNQFQGIMPEEELAYRKRALYEALPPAPPPPDDESDNDGGEEDSPPVKKRRAT